MSGTKAALSAAVLAVLAGVAGAAETKVSPEAQTLLTQVASAYGGLHSLQVAGTLSADLDIAGEPRTEKRELTGSFQAPNRFRHEIKGDLATGSTGDKFYAYAQQPNTFFTAKATNDAKPAASDIPDQVRQLLESQDPSILLAVAKDTEAALKSDATEISTAAPTTVNGASYDTLVLSMGADKPSTRLLIDPKTHLIRQSRTDLKQDLIKRGAPDVKKATVTIDYATVTPDAPVAEQAFAWAAPAGARETTPMQADAGAGEGAAKDLIGKPAPDFTLAQLDGKNVSLKDLKGSVVVLDFWATWCGPCVEGLPHVDSIFKDNKDKGVRAFAVNMQEESDKVKAFVEEKKLSLPVLIEPKGDVAEKYKVEGIPETVVIGKDGTVKKVFVGTGPDTEEQLRKAVADAVKG